MADLEQIDRRLSALEEWKNEQAMASAVKAERDRHMDKRFDELKDSVNEVKGYLLRIVWVIVLGIIGSFVTFVVSGGLSIGP